MVTSVRVLPSNPTLMNVVNVVWLTTDVTFVLTVAVTTPIMVVAAVVAAVGAPVEWFLTVPMRVSPSKWFVPKDPFFILAKESARDAQHVSLTRFTK